MKLGAFAKIDDLPRIQGIGFDYTELDTPDVVDLSDKDFEMFLDAVKQYSLPIRAGSRALPITEPTFFMGNFHALDWKGYINNACKRMSQLGANKIILGNGKARLMPEGNISDREQIFIDFFRMFCDIAGENGMELILEPLGPRYSNYLNTIPEAVRVIKLANMPNAFTMVDLRHLVASAESYEDIITFKDYIHHVHIDYPSSYPARRFPSLEDDFNYNDYLSALKKAGYNGDITVEADTPEDWHSACEKARKLLAEVLD